MNLVRIFDTTLRDGEQTPGVNLNVEEKVRIAKQLESLGVDIIEAGFPQASQGDFAAVQAVAEAVRRPVIAALARAVPGDIERAAQAVAAAHAPRIHTFIATSDIHMKYKLRKTPDQVLKQAVDAVTLAKSFVSDVEFSAEDATRTDPGFLADVLAAVIAAGATTVNIPDTVGYTTPAEFSQLITGLRRRVPGINDVIISVHCHDDLGLAVANSLAAIGAGAGQVECTINGLGERAGNAALEEIVMALHTRGDIYDRRTNIVTEQIYRTSRLVSSIAGVRVQPNKAIVGRNAFAHESGIHQDGMLKEPTTYEIMTPASIGVPESRLVLGKHSGRHAFRERLREMGYTELSDEQIERAYLSFIDIADRKKSVSERDISALIEERIVPIPEHYVLDYMQIVSGSATVATATVKISHGNTQTQEAACGDGPVDAVYKAIDRVTGLTINLENYGLQAVTGGKDALGEVMVRIRDNGNEYTGRGTSVDIIEASARAYLQAINKMLHARATHGTSEGTGKIDTGGV